MGSRDILSLVVFVFLLCALTALSSMRFGSANKEAALAAALKAELEWFMGDDLYLTGDSSKDRASLCLESDGGIDIELLSDDLSDTIIRPVPFDLCRRGIEKGNFGMFSAIYHHFGPDGEEAGHLQVIDIECRTSSSCIIDIDGFGSGYRHFVERQDQVWKVEKTRNRWIV